MADATSLGHVLSAVPLSIEFRQPGADSVDPVPGSVEVGLQSASSGAVLPSVIAELLNQWRRPLEFDPEFLSAMQEKGYEIRLTSGSA